MRIGDRALLLLQEGFYQGGEAGISLRRFMTEALGFPADYVEGRISTVFLDDKPVDDIDAARIAEGSRLSLSAAMPGLVGAVMRRKSPYASFREGISHRPDEEAGAGGAGADGGAPPAAPASGPRAGAACLVRVKLFNSVMAERGPALLARGVLVERDRAEALGLRGAAEEADGGPDLVLLRREEGAP